MLADLVDEVELAEVLGRPPDIEHLAVDPLQRGVEHDANRRGDIARMHVGAPELLAEDLEVAARPEISGELVDREIEAHARCRTVDRSQAQARGMERVALEGEQEPLDTHLLGCVQRDGSQLAVLPNRDRRVEHAAVVGAGRGEHEARHAGGLGVGDKRCARADVDVVRELGVPRAGRIADDGGEMDHRVDAGERRGTYRAVSDIPLDDLDAVALEPRSDVALAVQQPVEHAHLPPGGAQLAAGMPSDVSSAARDQDRLAHVSPSPRNGTVRNGCTRSINKLHA